MERKQIAMLEYRMQYIPEADLYGVDRKLQDGEITYYAAAQSLDGRLQIDCNGDWWLRIAYEPSEQEARETVAALEESAAAIINHTA